MRSPPVFDPLLVRIAFPSSVRRLPHSRRTLWSSSTNCVIGICSLRCLWTKLFSPKVLFLRFLSLNLLRLMRKRKSAQTDLLVRNVTRGATSGESVVTIEKSAHTTRTVHPLPPLRSVIEASVLIATLKNARFIKANGVNLMSLQHRCLERIPLTSFPVKRTV